MSFVTNQTRQSIEELLKMMKDGADSDKQEGFHPVLIFRKEEYDDAAIVTPIDTEPETWEEGLIRTFYKLFMVDETKMHWVGAVCESFGLVKDGQLLSPTDDELEPGQLEKDFTENPFSEVTEGVSVFLANDNNESEFFFYPFYRDDFGKAVFREPWIRSRDETAEGISETEQYLLRFQELMRQVRSGEISFDDE